MSGCTRLNQIEKIKKSLKSIYEINYGNAAVIIILKNVKEYLEILLIKRADNQTDPWSGQICLPGGKIALKDNNLLDTIIRETFEETKIDLIEEGYFLGSIHVVRSIQKPSLIIVPYVFLLTKNPQIELNKKELNNYFWIPLTELTKERKEKTSFAESSCYIIKDIKIWGLTYKILKDFIETSKIFV
jgi:8-oxo-dGTP pyrophosphatase MutT (NUDIX family)